MAHDQHHQPPGAYFIGADHDDEQPDESITVDILDDLLAKRRAAADYKFNRDEYRAATDRYFDALNASSDDVYRQHLNRRLPRTR